MGGGWWVVQGQSGSRRSHNGRWPKGKVWCSGLVGVREQREDMFLFLLLERKVEFIFPPFSRLTAEDPWPAPELHRFSLEQLSW